MPIPRILRALILCLTPFSIWSLPVSADVPELPAVAREMAAELGFDEAAVGRLQNGEIITTELSEGSEKELALAVAMLVPLGADQIYRELVNGRFFEVNRSILDLGELPDGDVAAKDFRRLELPANELAKLRAARPSSKFNLSTSEKKMLQATKNDADTLAAYHELLAARAKSYREGGASALAPYDRGRGQTANPGADLRTSALALSHLDERAPDFYRFLRDFPKHAAPKLYQRFFWSTQNIENRPTPVLSHWVMQQHPDYALAAERQFYVGQSYNALQVMGGAFALDAKRSLVFYTNRTATDQVTGFAGPAARGIALHVMLGAIVDLFEGIRSAIETGQMPRS